MNRYLPGFRVALGAITTAAIYLGASAGIALAQDTSTSNAAPTPPPAATVAQVSPANPSGVFPPGANPPGASTFTPGPGGAGHPPGFEYGVGEVVKMYQGGISKDIIINYINSTALPYHLTADQIIQVQALGLPQEITKAMILRDGQLQAQRAQFYAQMQQQQMQQQVQQPQPMPPPNGGVPDQSGAQVATPSTPPPSVTVVGSDDPAVVYDYGYPYYYGGWPYYYGGPWVVGGWGWGHGYGGYRGGGFHGGGFGGGHGGFGGGHGGGGGGGHR